MEHRPRHCRQDDLDDPVCDNHSGTRLVLLSALIPLAALAGWVAYTVARELGRTLVDPVVAQRFSYVAAGVAMLAVSLAVLRWQAAFSLQAQQQAEEEIDEMDEDSDDEYEEYP
jgi:hypothetical protein